MEGLKAFLCAFLAHFWHFFHPFWLVAKSDGTRKSLSGTFYIHLQFEPNPMVHEKLVWYLLYIHLQFEPNPMVHEKLVWHKSYIQFRVEPNSMVHEKLACHKSYIQFRAELNPVVREKLACHKSYIQFRVEPNSMVHEKLVWHKSYIHIRFRLNPVGSRQEMSIKGPIHKGTCLYRMERPTSIPQGSSITATFHKECFRKVVK